MAQRLVLQFDQTVSQLVVIVDSSREARIEGAFCRISEMKPWRNGMAWRANNERQEFSVDVEIPVAVPFKTSINL